MQARAEEQQRRVDSRSEGQASASAPSQEGEGYWAYMQRQLNERTEKLGIAGDSMEKLETTSAKWADDMGKFVQRQKRNAMMGSKLKANLRLGTLAAYAVLVVKGKFGL